MLLGGFKMDRLTKQLYNDYVHREIVRTYGQEVEQVRDEKDFKRL
jgi:hypothetical protein